MPVSSRPTLHLTVGLPGVGKTTLARELEQSSGGLRLTPDEWMVPLFGLRWADFGGKRDVLEGRLVWVGHQVLRAGVTVILDFGCWSPDERYALRAIADLAGADFELHYLTLPEDERRKRAEARWREAPGGDLRDDRRGSRAVPRPVHPAHDGGAPRLLTSSASDAVRELAGLGF